MTVHSRIPLSRAVLRRRRRIQVLVQRVTLLGSGSSLIVLGVLSVPTPIPIGFFLFAAGLYLMARGSKRARHSVKGLRRRVPPFSRGLNSVKHRLPKGLRKFIEHSDPSP